MERLETLVIGAGPAGLAAAACLSKRGAPFVIVEQATAVGSSWRRHYQRLHLHTDQAQSALPYLGFSPGTPRYPSREEMIGYLERYARHFALTPRLGERVLSIHPADNGWVATTTASIYRCQRVIVATGYNAVPYLPSWPGQEHFSGRIMHSSEYRNAEPFRGQSVLVIGFGNSGGEIAIDLHEHGARVAMAVRGAVNIVPRDIFGLPTVAIAHALSRLPAGLADALAAPLLRITIGDITKLGFRKLSVGPIEQILTKSRIPLIDIGTVRLVRSGDIEILGGVRSMSATDVTFDDGSARRFDAIIVATGYRPGLERFLGPRSDALSAHPAHADGAAERAPGLYFCGFTLSPPGMLREIGIEAHRIAQHISRKP